MSDVLSVVQNWRRPANVAAVVDAIRSQTVPSKLAIVDCGLDGYALPPDVLAKADYVFRVDRANLGPCCRFIPSMMIPQIPLTMFWLDDFLPGPRCLESFLAFSDTLFRRDAATIGQDGRLFADDCTIIRRRQYAEAGKAVESDVIVSSELCLTREVHNAIRFRDFMVDEYGADQISLFEDDLYLCLGIRRSIGVRSRVFTPQDESESHRATRLSSAHALASRPDHDTRRKEFVEMAMRFMPSLRDGDLSEWKWTHP